MTKKERKAFLFGLQLSLLFCGKHIVFWILLIHLQSAGYVSFIEKEGSYPQILGK